MNKTILQIPLTTDLRNSAEEVALAQGFSSLQEAVRVFLAKLAYKKIEIGFQEVIHLSKKAEKRYRKIDNDFENDKNSYSAKSVKDLMNQLDEHKVSQ